MPKPSTHCADSLTSDARGVATGAAMRLGHVRDVDDAVEARAIPDQLAVAALDQAAMLAEVELDLSVQAALSLASAPPDHRSGQGHRALGMPEASG